MSSPATPDTVCAACSTPTALVCASCLNTRYCSPACARGAWPAHRAVCADLTVLAELPDEALAPVPPAVPLYLTKSAAAERPGTGFECAVCGAADAAVCARCRLVGYCGREHQSKDWPAHKRVCRAGEFGVVPMLTWEQRVLAEARAAASGSLAAMAALPTIPFWDTGRDGAPPTKIMRAWRAAAYGGHALAQINIGVCYDFGAGVAKDDEAAVSWYALAAAQGAAIAQFNLGVCCQDGRGIAQDYKRSFALYAQAAAQGHVRAQVNLALSLEFGRGCATDIDAAVDWHRKAAAQGDAKAAGKLGGFYFVGMGTPQDHKLAAFWFDKAARKEHPESMLNIASCYEHGLGVPQNDETAAEWFGKAAAKNVSGAAACRDACLARVRRR
jgi:TPR repeat protein